MRTWNAAIVSAPSRTNIPAMQRNVKAMSRAPAVIRLSSTTAAPPAITPIARRANTTGSTKSNVTSSSADRADRRCRRCAGARAEYPQAPTLHEWDTGNEEDHEHPARDRDRDLRCRERERERGDDEDVHEGRRDEALPAEAHELVDPQTRQRRADPHHDHDERVDLEREPQDPEERDRVDTGALPATEPEGRDDRADHRHVAVFREREHRAPPHARVLREPAGNELRLGFGQIERRAVRLGERRDEVDQERERKDQRVHERACLGARDVDHRQGSHDEDHRHEREDLGDLVGDELTGRPETTNERVFVVRSPAGDDDAEHGHRTERRQIEKPNVEVRANNVLGERQDDPGSEHGAEDERGRRNEKPAVGRGRADVLLRNELERVRERLQEAKGSDVIRAETVLDDRLDLALEVDLQQRTVQNEEEREAHRDDQAQWRPNERIDPEGTNGHLYPPRASLRGGRNDLRSG